MSRRSAIIAAFMLIVVVLSLLFIRNRMTKLSATSEHSDGLLGKEFIKPDLAIEKKTDTHPSRGSVHPFCAPDSTVYLTQEQQEYKLGKRGKNTPDVIDAKNHGAKAKVTLRVVDSQGNPVPEANVIVAYFHRGEKPVEGKTDADGFFTAESMSESDVHFHAFKEGYYRTYRNYWFYREGQLCAENGRWLPWNPTLEVVMKEIRNPIVLKAQSIALRMPGVSGRFGFDFMVGDWVKPYGNGIVVDAWVESILNPKKNDHEVPWEHRLTFDFQNEGDGFVVYVKNNFSQMCTPYEAPNEGYTQQMHFVRTGKGDTVNLDSRLKENEGVVFRVRTRRQDGQWKGGFYGITVGTFQFPAGPHVRSNFRYLINMNEGNQNLEPK